MAAEGAHAERVIAFRRGEGAAARIVLVPRLTAALGASRRADRRAVGGHASRGFRRRWSGGVAMPAERNRGAGVRTASLQVGDALAELPVARSRSNEVRMIVGDVAPGRAIVRSVSDGCAPRRESVRFSVAAEPASSATFLPARTPGSPVH